MELNYIVADNFQLDNFIEGARRESIDDFLSFVSLYPNLTEPKIDVAENGCIRLKWQDGHKKIVFVLTGNSNIVFHIRGNDPVHVYKKTFIGGNASLDTVLKMVELFNLKDGFLFQ